jgi:hypothetical protein
MYTGYYLSGQYIYGPSGYTQSQKGLKFIRDARLSGHKTRLDTNASDFLTTIWAAKNELRPIQFWSTPDGSQLASKYRDWKDKMAKRRFDNK